MVTDAAAEYDTQTDDGYTDNLITKLERKTGKSRFKDKHARIPYLDNVGDENLDVTP